MSQDVYLDYAATTPVDPAVLKEMLPYFTEKFGNASSSTHRYGWQAKEAVNNSRSILAKHVGAEPTEIIFTSGATESINLALKGVFDLYKTKGKHIISCQSEHKSTLETLAYLESKGAKITYLPVDDQGLIAAQDLENAICDDTILISIMWVNNETGVIQNVKKIGTISRKHKVLFLCDATQAIGKVDVNVKENNIALMAFSAHKIYGPKGVGALYVSRKNPRASLATLIHGGSQEKSLRSGTLNTPAIVGFGKAISILGLKKEADEIKSFSDKISSFFVGLGATINGSPCCTHIINIQLPNVKAVNLLKLNKQFCFSLGSACSAESLEPSHVLKAMGLTAEVIRNSFRISIGRMTTAKEVQKFIEEFKTGLEL
jgi:cysteine desulfurase